jgi:hypothetical protein
MRNTAIAYDQSTYNVRWEMMILISNLNTVTIIYSGPVPIFKYGSPEYVTHCGRRPTQGNHRRSENTI